MRCIIVGDNKEAQYHPLHHIEEELKKILLPGMDIALTEDKSALEYNNLKQYQLCVLYQDCWGKKLSQSQMSSLICFCAQGGGILAIHNGISYQDNPEFAQLIGAKFTGHPPYQRLQYHVTAKDHPIVHGISDFEMDEEPYCFEFCNFTHPNVLLEYTLNEVKTPAAWTMDFGLGRVVYLAPGHDVNTFLNQDFKKLIQNSASWAAGRK